MYETRYPAKRDDKRYAMIDIGINNFMKRRQEIRKAFPELLYFSNDVGQGEARNNAYAWNLDIKKPLPFSNERLFKG